MKNIIILALGFFTLIAGAELLVRGASALAKKLKAPDIVIGLTVVAFGTSLPELAVNIAATLENQSEIAVSNVFGSNVANIFLILGICALIRPLKASSRTVRIEIPICLGVAVLGVLLCIDFTEGLGGAKLFSRTSGLLFLACFSAFLVYIWRTMQSEKESFEESPLSKVTGLRAVTSVVAGLLMLGLGGKAVEYGAVTFGEAMGISKSLLGATVIAIGTSLPELATSVVATYRGKIDIAVGNVVGSNIFNIAFIMGISATITPLPVMPSGFFCILISGVAALALYLVMFTGITQNTIDRREGLCFIVLYGAFVVRMTVVGL